MAPLLLAGGRSLPGEGAYERYIRQYLPDQLPGEGHIGQLGGTAARQQHLRRRQEGAARCWCVREAAAAGGHKKKTGGSHDSTGSV